MLDKTTTNPRYSVTDLCIPSIKDT